jgi:OOP family OmpA-OmpF porin
MKKLVALAVIGGVLSLGCTEAKSTTGPKAPTGGPAGATGLHPRGKTDIPKSDTPKGESPKPDAPKGESPKPDAPKKDGK